MSVDVVIVNFNTCGLLRECLESVARVHGEVSAIHTIVADNASADDSAKMVRSEFPGVELVMLPENLGFGAGNNRGVEKGRGEYILFLNSDARLTPGALAVMTAYLDAHHACVAVGPRLVYPDGTFHPSCRRFPTVWRCLWSAAGMPSRFGGAFKRFRLWLTEDEHSDGCRVDMVSGACFLMRRGYFEAVGGFDDNLFLFEEEFDIFYPASRRDLEVRYCADATVVHGAGKSVQANRMASFARFHLYRSKYYAFRKHYGAAAARVSYCLDIGVFGLSGIWQRIRRKPAEALTMFRACRQAWPASRLSGQELRALTLNLPD